MKFYVKVTGTEGFIDPTAIIGHPPEHFAEAFENQDYYPPVIHPTARVFKFVTIDSGTRAPTRVGARTAIFAHSHLGHDVVVGDDCDIATGVIIGGHATVGDRVRVGLNATILPYKTVGDDARVGAGAVVTRDVPRLACVMGNPARVAYYFCPSCQAHQESPVECDTCVWEKALAASAEHQERFATA